MRGTFSHDEMVLIRCAAVCLPLLAVRTAYSLIFQITGDMTWNAVKGNPTAYLVLTFLAESAIIYASILAILKISPRPGKMKHNDKWAQVRQQAYPLMDSERRSRVREPAQYPV